MLMRISDLHVSYGAVKALDGVTMEVQRVKSFPSSGPTARERAHFSGR